MASGQVSDPWIVMFGPGKRFTVTPAMGTTGQLIFAGPCTVARLINSDASAQTGAITVYDSASVAGISAANQVFKATLGAGQVIDLGLPMNNGLVVQMTSAAVTGVQATWT